ncbi:hypothetical protein IAU59_003081 [Kwoniella sp. CBS 9459]
MVDTSLVSAFLQSTAGEWVMILSLVFGGCCSNVWALEGILKDHPKSGTFLTFAQFVYVAMTNLSTQLEWRRPEKRIQSSGSRSSPSKGFRIPYPRLKDRKVPLSRWGVQVVLFLAISLMNNYAFGLKIPVTIHIIFRSGGLCVSMLVGRFIGKRRYSVGQMLAGLLITAGIVLATASAPRRSPRRSTSPSSGLISTSSNAPATSSHVSFEKEYIAGVALLALALFLSALLGLWQEQTYKVYGRQWKEALFYGHALSLPFFLPLHSTISSTYQSFASSPPMALFALPVPSSSALFVLDASPNQRSGSSFKGSLEWRDLVIPSALFALLLNILTQGICVRGVNRLTSRVNAVTVNLILTVRKAVSLGISVWYYGSGMTPGLAAGGCMVLMGTVIYSVAPGPKGLPTSSQADQSTIKEKTTPQTVAIPNSGISGTSCTNRHGDNPVLPKKQGPSGEISLPDGDAETQEIALSVTGSDLMSSASPGRFSAGLRPRHVQNAGT